ncbi:ComF family protein [Paenibacillus sp. 1011MAR3C5]|uniref:ComF family protein n=1 Tax=Paenibacillus sp. 1011MAR3C5 TaxID=1675787 RepID=UPI000E6CBCD0|nr:phosphoribosyltransferase family protein [Paenibacillus sp. 1011MAR3C5]RJE85627.1 ComF family protein [Paenibacillus sp. 1011MAR3C5]
MSRLGRRMGHLKSILRSAGDQSMEWLSPDTTGCIVCGKAVLPQQGSPYPERGMASYRLLRQSLCISCFASIPWLDRIECLICGRGVSCEDCLRRTERHFICNRSAVGYSPVMREWLAMYKYRGHERLAPLLAEMLVPGFIRLTEETAARDQPKRQAGHHRETDKGVERLKRWAQRMWNPDAAVSRCWDAITYVPISGERAEERGFNQAQQMARYLSDKFEIPIYDLLIRDRHTEKMSFKTKVERQRDSQTLFIGNEAQLRKLSRSPSTSNPKSQRILLIDDIYTTGSTAEACASALFRHASRPVHLYTLTWARS